MRFMMLMIPLGYETAPPDVKLDPERVSAMMKYNEALKDAGILITLDGLHPPSAGARVSFATGKPIVTDGPFTEAKEVLGGYWMIDVKSREEAIAWAMRCPASSNEIIEIRQVQEMTDFSEEVQEAAKGGQRLRRAAGQDGAPLSREFTANPSTAWEKSNEHQRYVPRSLPRQQDQRENGGLERAAGGRAARQRAAGNRGVEGLGRKAPGGDRRARWPAGQDQEG
jgi:hypothetical protein